MKNKVTNTIDNYKMICAGDIVCVALSGGADSVALLHYFCTNQEILQLKAVLACHLNHMLRGEESQRDELFVRKLCAKHKVELICETSKIAQVAEENDLSIEEAAREIRYALFQKVQQERGCKIATAHTLSDSMETTVFHLARGTGTKGLMGIPPVREQFIRPLITCSRKEIEEYCSDHELEFVTDSTNLTDQYTRNYIRHHVMEHLYRVNPAVETAFLRLYEQISQQEDYLEQETSQAWEMIVGETGYQREPYLKLHPALATRVLMRILEQHNLQASHAKIQLLYEYIVSGSGSVQLSKQQYLQVTSSHFYLKQETEQEISYYEEQILPMELGETREMVLSTGRKICFTLTQCEQNKNFVKNMGKTLKKVLDYDKINGIVLVRQKKDGDRITLSKRGCTKSLKKLFCEMQLPTQKRLEQIVLCDAEGVIWVEGAGCSQRVELDSQTTKYLEVDLGD